MLLRALADPAQGGHQIEARVVTHHVAMIGDHQPSELVFTVGMQKLTCCRHDAVVGGSIERKKR